MITGVLEAAGTLEAIGVTRFRGHQKLGGVSEVMGWVGAQEIVRTSRVSEVTRAVKSLRV